VALKVHPLLAVNAKELFCWLDIKNGI